MRAPGFTKSRGGPYPLLCQRVSVRVDTRSAFAASSAVMISGLSLNIRFVPIEMRGLSLASSTERVIVLGGVI